MRPPPQMREAGGLTLSPDALGDSDIVEEQIIGCGQQDDNRGYHSPLLKHPHRALCDFDGWLEISNQPFRPTKRRGLLDRSGSPQGPRLSGTRRS